MGPTWGPSGDLSHTNNILQIKVGDVYSYQVVQVMFHALMPSSMTSPFHKVCQNFEIHISTPMFQLERRSKAQNIGLLVYSTSGITSGKKSLSRVQNGGHFENVKTKIQFDFIYEKVVPNYARRRISHGDDVIDDVTGWPPNRPSIFLYKWN